MVLNGVLVESFEQLEGLLLSLPEESQIALRGLFEAAVMQGLVE